MSDDQARQLLRDGDALVRDGRYDVALRRYAAAARLLEGAGFALKAVAVLKQIRQIVTNHAPAEHDAEEDARRRLPVLYRSLGLESEALAIEAEAK